MIGQVNPIIINELERNAQRASIWTAIKTQNKRKLKIARLLLNK
jgi:hypothetical protein